MISSTKQFNIQDTLRVRNISDLHFGHDKNSPWAILKAVRHLIPDSPEMEKVDAIFITGDWTDSLLTLKGEASYCSQMGIFHILGVANKYNILVRLIEGTKSHDRNQSKQFILWAKEHFPDVDVKYYDKLAIEYIPKYKINILYLPDEWNPSAEKTMEEVKALMLEHGLSKVDFALTHVTYTYQLNGIQSPAFHDPVQWSELVNYNIFSGHIHKRSRFLKIIVPGSLPRTGHGEEEPKGIVEVLYRGYDDYDYKFMINPFAKRFDTLNVTGMILEDVIQWVADINLPAGSAIRFEYVEEPIEIWTELISDIFPQYEFTHIFRGKKKEKVGLTSFFNVENIQTPIHEGNIESLIIRRASEIGVPENTIDYIKKVLNDL